jgi:hypothetical protein
MEQVLGFHGLDERYWRVMVVPDGSGEPVRYLDDNARVDTGRDGLCATIDPFSRFHDTDPRRNNAKLMYLSTARIPVPATGVVECSATMAVRAHRQVPFDLADAYGTLNLVDVATGMVINCAATNDTVYAIVERLPAAGHETFRYRVVLDVDTCPGQPHHYTVVIRDGTGLLVRVDDVGRYETCLPVAVGGLQLGVGVFSARDPNRFPRRERQRGQGATVRWGQWRVRAA